MTKAPPRYYGTRHDDTLELVTRILEVLTSRGISLSGHRIGLFNQVELTLVLLRQNMSLMVVGDLFGISQSCRGSTARSPLCWILFWRSPRSVWNLSLLN